MFKLILASFVCVLIVNASILNAQSSEEQNETATTTAAPEEWLSQAVAQKDLKESNSTTLNTLLRNKRQSYGGYGHDDYGHGHEEHHEEHHSQEHNYDVSADIHPHHGTHLDFHQNVHIPHQEHHEHHEEHYEHHEPQHYEHHEPQHHEHHYEHHEPQHHQVHGHVVHSSHPNVIDVQPTQWKVTTCQTHTINAHAKPVCTHHCPHSKCGTLNGAPACRCHGCKAVGDPCSQHNVHSGKLLHPFPYDAHKYIQCDPHAHGIMYIRYCPHGLVFDAHACICNYPHEVHGHGHGWGK